MDSDRFDRFSRSFAAISRRDAARLLGAGGVAAVAALLGRREAEARCRPKTRRCGSGNCCPKGEVCADLTASVCISAAGSCPAGADSCTGNVACTTGPTSPDSCHCFKTFKIKHNRFVDGPTRCGQDLDLTTAGCGACSTDADCLQQFPNIPGVFCRLAGGCGCTAGLNKCAQPCPA